jgi:dihydrofolate reductase
VIVSIIAAQSPTGGIGARGTLPWHLPADLRRFKALTMGHAIIMGRKTWESIGRPLPGRRSIVLTRQSGYAAPGAQIAENLEEALRLAAGTEPGCLPGRAPSNSLPQEAGDRGRAPSPPEEVFIIGGAAVYRDALPVADRLYLTQVQADVEADVYFPPLDLHAWRLVEQSHTKADDRNPYEFTHYEYERIR